jgi:hypothetical protein
LLKRSLEANRKKIYGETKFNELSTEDEHCTFSSPSMHTWNEYGHTASTSGHSSSRSLLDVPGTLSELYAFFVRYHPTVWRSPCSKSTFGVHDNLFLAAELSIQLRICSPGFAAE